MKVPNALKNFYDDTIGRVDETILKQFTRIVRKYELNGGNKLDLAMKFHIQSDLAYLASGGLLIGRFIGGGFVLDKILQQLLLKTFHDSDVDRTYEEKIYEKEKLNGGGNSIEYSLHDNREFSKKSRFYIFGSGLGYIGSGLSDIYDTLEGRKTDISHSIWKIGFGYSLATLGSSMYIKDTDDKLLQKSPLLVQALKSLKEAEILPSTSLEPIKINNNLENKLDD